jgi:hypothetical protein
MSMALPAIIEPAAAEPEATTTRRRLRLPRLPWGAILRRTPLVLAAAGALYYGAVGLSMHRIDDDPEFVPPEHLAGGSAAVSMAAALIDREVNEHRWMANDPFIAPNAFLDDAPNFQLGIQRAAARFSFELLDQIARTRGSSRSDRDLERATGYLSFPGDIWVLNFQKSLLPMVPSEDQYRAGLRALASYNERLGRGDAVFQRRADALAETLSRISGDLGSSAAQLDNVRSGGVWIFSSEADDVFYQNKGMLYAYSMILGELGRDFESLIQQRGAAAMWAQAMDSLEQASRIHPLVVLNAPSEGSIFANHLMLQGFYMKRAILQLEEVASVLAV